MIYLILVLIVIISAYLFFLFRELQQINDQLDYISHHETNAELTHTSKNRLIVELVKRINHVIRDSKLDRRQRIQQETELHRTIANLSHDLRTPITTAFGYSQLVSERYQEDDLAPRIQASLRESTEYLDYLVDYTSLQEKKLNLHYEKMNLSEFITQQILQYYEGLTQRNISVTIDIQQNITLVCDHLVLQRMMTNLFGNVMKYAKNECSLRLTQSADDIILALSNQTTQSESDLNYIMQRFVTGDEARSNKSIGLGISIIQECVNLLQGNMQLSHNNATFTTIITFKNALE